MPPRSRQLTHRVLARCLGIDGTNPLVTPGGSPNPQTGSYAPNAREGARSEYLAQYVFSRFGTSLPVLRQEDHGLDLHCKLSERKGRRAWPVAYYSVQVKSNNRPVLCSSRDSVEWLVGYSSALQLCVVDKKLAICWTARLRHCRLRVKNTGRRAANSAAQRRFGYRGLLLWRRFVRDPQEHSRAALTMPATLSATPGLMTDDEGQRFRNSHIAD